MPTSKDYDRIAKHLASKEAKKIMKVREITLEQAINLEIESLFENDFRDSKFIKAYNAIALRMNIPLITSQKIDD